MTKENHYFRHVYDCLYDTMQVLLQDDQLISFTERMRSACLNAFKEFISFRPHVDEMVGEVRELECLLYTLRKEIGSFVEINQDIVNKLKVRDRLRFLQLYVETLDILRACDTIEEFEAEYAKQTVFTRTLEELRHNEIFGESCTD